MRLDFGRGVGIGLFCELPGLLADCMLQAIRSPHLKETIMPLDVFLDEDVPDFPFTKAGRGERLFNTQEVTA